MTSVESSRYRDRKKKVQELHCRALRDSHSLRFHIRGWSMWPKLGEGDVVVVDPTEEACPGDIVLSYRGDECVAHRLVSRRNGQIVTRGDAVECSDPPMPESSLMGKVVRIERASGSRRVRALCKRIYVRFLTRLKRGIPGIYSHGRSVKRRLTLGGGETVGVGARGPGSPRTADLDRNARATPLDQVRSLVADLAMGRPPEPGCCRNWGPDHWDAAGSHSLIPWLYEALRSCPDAGVAPEILDILRQAYTQSVIRSLAFQAYTSEVLSALKDNNIRVLALKGAYLGTRVYKNPALRLMCDVDLMVAKKDFHQTRRTLESLGFRAQMDDPGGFRWALRSSLSYVRVGRVVESIDVHWALWMMDYYRFPSPAVWDDAVEGELYGCPVLFLSPELNFVHLAVHSLNHADRMRNRLDLALLAHRIGLDWDRLLSLARSFKVMRPLHRVFEELGRNWAVVPPAKVTGALDGYVPHWIEDRVIHHRFRYAWRLFARMRFFKGRRFRMYYLGRTILPAREYREALLGTPRMLPYLRSKIGFLWALYKRG